MLLFARPLSRLEAVGAVSMNGCKKSRWGAFSSWERGTVRGQLRRCPLIEQGLTSGAVFEVIFQRGGLAAREIVRHEAPEHVGSGTRFHPLALLELANLVLNEFQHLALGRVDGGDLHFQFLGRLERRFFLR